MVSALLIAVAHAVGVDILLSLAAVPVGVWWLVQRRSRVGRRFGAAIATCSILIVLDLASGLPGGGYVIAVVEPRLIQVRDTATDMRITIAFALIAAGPVLLLSCMEWESWQEDAEPRDGAAIVITLFYSAVTCVVLLAFIVLRQTDYVPQPRADDVLPLPSGYRVVSRTEECGGGSGNYCDLDVAVRGPAGMLPADWARDLTDHYHLYRRWPWNADGFLCRDEGLFLDKHRVCLEVTAGPDTVELTVETSSRAQ